MATLWDLALPVLQSWAVTRDDFKYFVAVDVGATNTRVAVRSTESERAEYTEVAKFKCGSTITLYAELQQLAVKIVEAFQGKNASAAGLALAGRIVEFGEKAIITNWAVNEQEICKNTLPETLFPHSRTRFLNDLEGCCYGVLSLGFAGKLGLYFEPLFGIKPQHHSASAPDLLASCTTSAATTASPAPAPAPVAGAPGDIRFKKHHYCVLAMGTGLGCGLLLSLQTTTASFEVVPLEAGHCLVPNTESTAPNAANDNALIQYLSEKIYGGKHTIEFEDICSGRGLLDCFKFVTRDVADEATAAIDASDKVALSAVRGSATYNEHAEQAMKYHYRYLMRAAQNLCIATLAKGIFLCGDNQVNNDPFVESIKEDLQAEFLNHPKHHWLEEVKTYRQTSALNFNLNGTFYVAESLSE